MSDLLPEPENGRDGFDYNCFDGFRILVSGKYDDAFKQIGDALHVEVRFDAEVRETLELCHHPLTVQGKAQQRQLKNVLDAVAHYLNTTGDLDMLLEVLEKFRPLCEQYHLELTDDWYLLEWVYDVSENKYLFANDQLDRVLIVCPEEYTEELSLFEFNSSLEAEEAAEEKEEDDL